MPHDDSGAHRVLLPDGSERWALWRCAGVRGAGFAISDVLRLASPQAAAAADRLRAAEDEAEQRRNEAIVVVSRELEGVERGAPEGRGEAIRKLKKRKLPASADLPAAARAAVERFAAAGEEAQRAAESYLALFSAERQRLSGELRAVARDGRFREAVLWQNPHVLRAGIDPLLRHGDKGRKPSRERRLEQIVASYLQRFCTKNDTIGFFGPVGWATVGEGEEPISVRHGPNFLAQRRVFFEGWCIDAVAATLSADRALRLGIAPRRGFVVRADGRLVGRSPELALPPEQQAVLALCDGRIAARDLAQRLVEAGAFPDAATVYGTLEQLHAARLLTWGFDLPVVLEPERVLQQQIECLEGADAAREAALRMLGELESLRQAVGLAAGDDRALDAALQRLELRFTQLTGLGSTRGPGETYAGRTLVFEDCRRGTEVELGTGVLAALAPPLSLVLASARWLTYASAELHRERFEEAYRELRQAAGSSRIDLVSLCLKVLPSLMDPRTSPVRQQILPRFRQRWAEVLDLPADEARQVSYTSEELRSRVLRAFDAPGPGWMTARHHSPDLMIAASGPEAVRRGDFRFVLGELHAGMNTLGANVFVAQHPSPRQLVAAMEDDLPEPCVRPTLPKVWQQDESDALLGILLPALTGRLSYGLATADDLVLEISPAPPRLPSWQVLSPADLVVERGESGLQVIEREGSRSFDLLDFLQMAIAAQVVGAFKIFAPRAHLPRITIDRLILWRESWSLAVADLEFAREATEARRFSEARRWADRLGLPRFLFVKAPHERKPFFLDLESPFSIEIFTRAVRGAADKRQGRTSLSLSEMVPGPGETWLSDHRGRRYTSELRLVAVDRSG